jgi:GABA(A) receptor-associated protein
MPSFREEFIHEQRYAESQKIREKYPDKIPVIVELNEKYGWFTKTEKLPELDKKKYLVPDDLKFGQFFQVIRKRIKLDPEKAMFMFVGDRGEIPPTGETMAELYEKHADSDGFVYFSITGESVYGKSV